MSLWQKLLPVFMQPKQEKMTSLELFREIYGSPATKSGVSVNYSTALEVTTVFDCCRIIADGISQVPLRVYRDTGTGRQVAKDHPLYSVINTMPNPWQTSFEYRETFMFHTLLAGNHYSFINRVGREGRIAELIPLEPKNVMVEREKDMSLKYMVTGEDGIRKEIPAANIWHLRGPSWNSWLGLDSVKYAREAIGLSLATEETHSDFHKNGVKSSGVYSVEGSLNPDQYKDLLEWVLENYNKGHPMILDRGAKWTPLAMSGVDSQHIETRKHQIEEICRAFRVMPIMVGHTDKTATYASAEQMFLAHVVHTLSPWYERVEHSINKNLLTETDRRNGYYVKFTPNALMRGAAKDRGEFYAKALGSAVSPGWMTPNEVRELEEKDKIEGGDELFKPFEQGEQDAQSDPAA